mmetsp:Transcript_8331/g.31373  ORF Transcript_8331/g.31373 Transcript_8331/m.31373 type:complete len:208 (-) Transcript_8331:318-941(-)
MLLPRMLLLQILLLHLHSYQHLLQTLHDLPLRMPTLFLRRFHLQQSQPWKRLPCVMLATLPHRLPLKSQAGHDPCPPSVVSTLLALFHAPEKLLRSLRPRSHRRLLCPYRSNQRLSELQARQQVQWNEDPDLTERRKVSWFRPVACPNRCGDLTMPLLGRWSHRNSHRMLRTDQTSCSMALPHSPLPTCGPEPRHSSQQRPCLRHLR